jgi:DNA-binding beta-propeller fold protein YncE
VNRREFVALAAATPFGLRSTLTAPAPRALVTCDAEARVAVVDLGSFRVLEKIATLADPRAVELVGSHAVLCHTAVGAVSILDAHGHVRHVLRDFVEPRYTAAHPNGELAFVSDSGRSALVAIDVVRGEVVGRVRLREWARHVSVDPSGRIVWVGLSSASPDVAVVDVSQPARLRHVATVTPPFRAHDVGFLPGGAHVWVTSGLSKQTGIFDRAGKLRVALPADLAPQHVTFGDGVAYVTSGDSGTLHVQRLDDGRILRTAPIPLGSYNVQFGFGRVLTASLLRGTLTVLNAHGAVLARVEVSESCHDACFLPPA